MRDNYRGKIPTFSPVHRIETSTNEKLIRVNFQAIVKIKKCLIKKKKHAKYEL